MTNVDTNDDSEERSRPRAGHPHDLDLPRFLKNNDSIENGIAALAAERPAVSVANEAAAAAHVTDLMEQLAVLIKVPPNVPPIGADAAIKVLKCFETVATDVRAIAADRVKAAVELQQEAETYATVLLEAGRVLATRVSAESARSYKLSLLLREAREVICGPTSGETAQ